MYASADSIYQPSVVLLKGYQKYLQFCMHNQWIHEEVHCISCVILIYFQKFSHIAMQHKSIAILNQISQTLFCKLQAITLVIGHAMEDCISTNLRDFVWFKLWRHMHMTLNLVGNIFGSIIIQTHQSNKSQEVPAWNAVKVTACSCICMRH